MALQVVMGTANAGKTGEVYAQLRSAARASQDALLLLPSPADAARAMAELAADFPCGLEITTLGSHLDACWRSHGDGRRLVTPVERAIVLEESGKYIDSGCLAGSVGTPGFRRLLTNLVQRAAESDDYQAPVASGCGTPGDGLHAYIEAYRAALACAGLIERGEAYRLLAAIPERLALPPIIAVSGFTGLTGPQEHYLTAVSGSREVVIALTYAPTVPATESAERLVSRLSGAAAVVTMAGSVDAGTPSELVMIEQGLGAPPVLPVRADGAVILSEAWGRASEAARIVREIQDACQAGFSPESIAVVFRDPATHIRSLRPALAEAGVDAEWDVQVPFERTGIGRCLLGLISLCAGAADRVVWMDVMRSPYSPCTSAELDELDARIRRMAVPGESTAHFLDSRLKGEGARFIREARAAFRSLGGEASEGEWHRLASGMLGRAHTPANMLDLDGMLDAAAVRVLVEAVAGLRAIAMQGPTYRVLAAALEGSPVSVSATGEPGRIQVTSAERIRGRRFDCVILGGLTAGEFPRMRREDGFGAFGAEAVLARAGIDTAPRDDLAAERLLFYQVVTRARQRLVLSRRSHDDDGQPLQGSVFVEEVLDLYLSDGVAQAPLTGVERRILGPDTGLVDGLASRTDRRITRSRARVACGCGGDGLSAAPRDTVISLSAENREALGAQEVFSISDIEMYLQCPYRWYIERVIRPADLDESIDASAAGRTAHEVLARFYEQLPGSLESPRLTPENLDAGRRLHRRIAAEVLARIRAHTAQEKAMMRQAVAGTWRILVSDARLFPGFEPRFHEWSFGMEDQPEQFEGYALRGRIDRIDTNGESLCITDYKLGGLSAAHGALRSAEEGKVQLPLYALVASRRLGLAIGGGVYRSITRGSIRGFVTRGLSDETLVSTDIVDGAGLESIIEQALAVAGSAVTGMRAGSIDPEPTGGRCSPYCAARGFCPVWRSAHA